jgi:hypothetical protein
VRFTNRDVLDSTEGVYLAIERALAQKEPRHRGSSPPSPALPARGRVPAGDKGAIEPETRSLTLTLAGRVGKLGPQVRSGAGEGGATRSGPKRGTT